jgi:hypothetical protein
MTTRKQQAAQENAARMLASTLDFISRFPDDPFIEQRKRQAEQMRRNLGLGGM